MQVLTIDADALTTVHATAAAKAAGTAWERVLARALPLLQQAGHIAYDRDWIYIPSQRGAGSPYRVDRETCAMCQCEAHGFGGRPCTHRAAARLVVRLLEAAPQPIALEIPAKPAPVFADDDLSDLFSD